MNRWIIGNKSLLVSRTTYPAADGAFGVMELIERIDADKGHDERDAEDAIFDARAQGMDNVKIAFADVAALDAMVGLLQEMRGDMVAANEAGVAMAEDGDELTAAEAAEMAANPLPRSGGPLDNPEGNALHD